MKKKGKPRREDRVKDVP
jgi:hypothetical protein